MLHLLTSSRKARAVGKFLYRGGEKLYVHGVTYGTFRTDGDGRELLDPGQVEVVGPLGDFLTGTGFRITPVVGLVPPGLAFAPAPAEVDAVFEFPLDVLLDPAAPRRERQQRNGVMRDVWIWPHPDHYIWGATAAILVHLAERLRAAM